MNSKQEELYYEIFNCSKCQVKSIMDNNHIYGLDITFFGDLARMPGKSNDKDIGRRKSKSGKVVPFIRNSDQVIARKNAMVAHYRDACMNQGDPLRSFGDRLIHVHAWLANYKGNWDSHNCSKAIGDFLEEAAIINDDSTATIWCEKLPIFLEAYEIAQTTIFILDALEASVAKAPYLNYLWEKRDEAS